MALHRVLCDSFHTSVQHASSDQLPLRGTQVYDRFMNHLLRKRLQRWRTAIAVGLFAFAIGQTIGVAHLADATLHADGAPCHICQAIGHAATPPTPAAAPVVAPQLGLVIVCVDFVAAIVRPTFSPHAPRAPPSFL